MSGPDAKAARRYWAGLGYLGRRALGVALAQGDAAWCVGRVSPGFLDALAAECAAWQRNGGR